MRAFVICANPTPVRSGTTSWLLYVTLLLTIVGLVEIGIPVGPAVRAKYAWVGAAVFVMSVIALIAIAADAAASFCD